MQRSQRHRRKPRRLILIIIAILLIIMGVRHFNSTSARLKSAWNKIIFTSNNNVSIAVYSPKTHQIYTSSNAPQHKFRTASTVKVSILAGILAKQQSPLTSHQKSLATKMIEQSDNDSTSELFEDYLGGKNGLQQTFEKFGMTQSREHVLASSRHRTCGRGCDASFGQLVGLGFGIAAFTPAPYQRHSL